MDQAVPPSGNPVIEIYGKIKDEQNKTFSALKEKDEEWKQFGVSPGYWLVKEYVENLIKSLEGLEDQAFESGVNSDELVMRRAVVKLTKANLLSLIQKVERTTESVKRSGKSTVPRRGGV